jgi:ethanolamine ammonia-lyase small subunit
MSDEKDLLLQRMDHCRQLQDDRQADLSRFTHARVGMGHAGGMLKCRDWLNFQLGFAQAKDAVSTAFPTQTILEVCHRLQLDTVIIESQARDLQTFLLQPDAGRQLSLHDESVLTQLKLPSAPDLLIGIAGGLSPIAIAQQLPDFLPLLIEQVRALGWRIAPVFLTPRGRVALGDQVNQFFRAKLTVMCIGERPGLSSPDSMGIYFTYGAKPGCTDDQRNCISNIHARGLSHQEAVTKLIYLLQIAEERRKTGVSLKDDALSSPGTEGQL